MNEAKIQLSTKEKELVSDANWILTKNAIMQKIKTMLAELMERQKNLCQRHHPLFSKEILSISPKISKGENYHGLPYLVLDCPRYFSIHQTCAIRTFFWWGNFFSVT